MPGLGKLLALVETLRGPDGCPWDREQRLADVRAYLIEEAHEVAAAIDRVAAAAAAAGAARDLPPAGDPAWEELADELGDLLFQAAFVARLAEEAGAFTAAEPLARIHAKMVARHPHVFAPRGGEREELADAAAVERVWERRKLAERRDLAAGGEEVSLLDGVPRSLPALTAAYRMTQKAAGVGFDWPDAAAVLAKVDEEVAELRAELGASPAGGGATPGVREEVGDLLFTAANLARKLGVDPEAALAAANGKFRRRFDEVERRVAADGRNLEDSDLEEMDALWNNAKAGEQAR